MNAERWRDVEQVLDRALDSDPTEWPAIVAAACGTDEALRREVESLLAGVGRPAGILDSGPGAVAAEVVREGEAERLADALVGTQLGAWRVLRQIGRGGMSRVFLGERSDGAFVQQVAIKVLRAGLDTAADIQRFRSERQILASLDHPNIARLLDGGVAPDGRPYLVLEYIEGEPLTEYCDARSLGLAARLRLFLAVAEATQSAHRQLVVHRDLKPSNILVGADGRPRLLDFGVAKILDPAHHGARGATMTRRRWMTPEYAAPEQFSGEAVTTATDVYQLGAVLYELLSGRRPFEPAAGERGQLEGRVLRDDPPPPSTYAPALRGDLDAVVRRALRKEPAARYASVADLAADVQRYLDGEPVAARAGERAYRWRRLARRHALALSLGAAAVATVAGYVATLAVQNRRIAHALAAATVEREKAEQITGFLLGLFQANEPNRGGARADTISARTLLVRGEARANALGRQPEVQAAMLDVIGRVRGDLGAFDEARPSLERALAIRRRALGDSHPDVAESIANLATLDEMTGRFVEAQRGYRTALGLQRAAFGDTSTAALFTLFKLGFALHAGGRYKDAAPVLEEWERLAAARPGRRDALQAHQILSLAQWVEAGARGDSAALGRAERLFREALAIRRSLYGPRHADVAFVEETLAALIWNRRRDPEAEPLFRDAIATLRDVYPDGHPDLAATLAAYGRKLQSDRRADEAVPLFRDALGMARRYMNDDHVLLAAYVSSYADALRRVGDYAGAEPLLREAIVGYRRTLGDGNLMVVRSRINLGDVLRALGRTREAETMLLDAYSRLSAERGDTNPQTQVALRQLVKLYDGAGRRADAARYRRLLASADTGAASRGSIH